MKRTKERKVKNTKEKEKRKKQFTTMIPSEKRGEDTFKANQNV